VVLVVVQLLVVMVLLVAAAPMPETLAVTFLGREKALLGKAIEVDLEILLRLMGVAEAEALALLE
jgi:hypothetical protein